MIKIIADRVSMDLPKDLQIQLTIENPILSTDRIPVAHTTMIEFPMTQRNLGVFGFQDKLFLRPQRVDVPASLHVNELCLLTGTLSFDSLEDGLIKASFVGADIDEILSKDASEVKLSEWFFPMASDTGRKNYAALLDSAASGYEPFVCPPIRKKNQAESTSYLRDEQEKKFINVYKSNSYALSPVNGNTVFYSYHCPAIRLSELLQKMLSENSSFEDFDLMNLYDYVLLTTSNPKGIPEQYSVYGGMQFAGVFRMLKFSLASFLPKIQAGELLKEILKMFCLSVYAFGSQFRIISNKSIILDSRYDNWSDKISDTYTFSLEKKKSYQCGYTHEFENVDADEEPVTVSNILTMLNHGEVKTCKEYFEIQNTHEVYLRDIYVDEDHPESASGVDIQIELLKQTNLQKETTDDSDSFDSKVSFIPIKTCVCYYEDRARKMGLWSVPDLDIPASGADRPSDLHIGLFLGRRPVLTKTNTVWMESNYFYPFVSPTPYDLLGKKSVDSTITHAGLSPADVTFIEVPDAN